MSDLFSNKIAAAILATALGFIGINKIAGIAVHADIPSEPAYSVYVPGASTEVVEIPAPFPQTEWIAGIDPVKGAKVFKKCTSCHNAEAGGKNSTGPALWNVVGRPAATGADYDYSRAMKAAGVSWNYAELDEYLTNPKAYVPKTKMAFIGVKKAGDRAAVIEYLRLRADAPLEALTEAAAIPGADVGHVDEAHIEDAAVDQAPDGTVEHEMAPAEDGEIIEEIIEAPAEGTHTDAAAEIVDDVVEEVVEQANDAAEEIVEEVPTPDGGH